MVLDSMSGSILLMFWKSWHFDEMRQFDGRGKRESQKKHHPFISPQNGRDWSSARLGRPDVEGRRRVWLCLALWGDGPVTSTSLYQGGRWVSLVSTILLLQETHQDGVVATLARIPIPPPDLPLPAAPLLQPFPSLRMNLEGDCNALQNVDAIEVRNHFIAAASILQLWDQIDPLGRLWVVDSGQTAPFSRPHRKCPPKIFVFDLANGQWLIWLRKIFDPSIPLQKIDWWPAMFLLTIGTHCSSRLWSTCRMVRVTPTPTSVTLPVAEC